MRNRKRKLKIERWDESGTFVPVLRENGQKSALRAARLFDLGNENATVKPLKPIGFYVAYSYTLFRKGQRPDDPFYAFF